MDVITSFLSGLALALTPELLLAAFVGAFLGTLVGVLPGIGPVAGAAIILPLTFAFSPAVGLIMIAAIYLGAQYGGSTTAVLLNIPGDSSAIVSTFDGHKMAQKGRAGAALSIMAVGSFVAATIGLIIMIFSAKAVSDFALNFGSTEFFALTAGGLLLLARISGGSLGGGLFPMALGLALATIGNEASASYNRYTFGNLDLALGLSLAAVAVGIFGISEILYMIEDKSGVRKPLTVKLRDLFPTKKEWGRAVAPWARGSVLGFFFGLLPIPSATMSTFASYRLEKAVSKNRKEIGEGAVEGIAGPEAANNGAAIGSMVPVMLLGLPFSATLAMMISAMVVQGIQPGPLLMTLYPDLFWSVMAAMFVANFMLLILNLPMIGVWIRLLKTPQYILIPLVVVLGLIGSYSLNNNMIDVWTMFFMGLIGYGLRKLDLSLASFLIGFVLGPMIEKYFVQSIFIGLGDPMYFVSTPIAAGMWFAVIVVMVGGLILNIIRAISKKRASVVFKLED
jgi:putative tricarboxylic transport membrane protein